MAGRLYCRLELLYYKAKFDRSIVFVRRPTKLGTGTGAACQTLDYKPFLALFCPCTGIQTTVSTALPEAKPTKLHLYQIIEDEGRLCVRVAILGRWRPCW